MNDIEYNLTDAIIERPQEFRVGRKGFKLYPVTLAKMYLLKRQVDELGVDTDVLKENVYLEALRLAKEKREVCSHILAYHTAPNSYRDLFDSRAVTIRKNIFIKETSDEELAALMIYVLTADKTDEFLRHLGLDAERERMNKVIEAKRKGDKGSLTFGGLSIFGTFIGQLKEMGYSDNEILYEKGYTYLRLMLADKITTIVLTDEERQSLYDSVGGSLIDAGNPESADKVKAVLAERGISVK